MHILHDMFVQAFKTVSHTNFSVRDVEIVFTVHGDVMETRIVLMPQMKMIVVSYPYLFDYRYIAK